MKLTYTLILLSSIISPLYARVGCLDKSMHLEQKFDYKKFHFVQCNCPCEQEYEMTKNGTCTKCSHRRDEVLMSQVNTDPKTLINIARLKQCCTTRK